MSNKKRLNVDDLCDVVKVKEAAAFLGVSERTINTMIHKDQLKSFKFGNCRLILKEELLDSIGYKREAKKEVVKVEQRESDIKEIQPGIKTVFLPKTTGRYGYESMEFES